MLQPLIDAGFIEMTEPQSLRSPTQKYRTTEKGMEIVKAYE
jgi:ATP-dependent DNA helicase RecG